MMLIYTRILMSTIAPKLSEFAMNTYSFPCNRVNKRRNVNAKTLDEQCELRIHLRLTQTCESSKSSFPLFISDGKISPWPGGYLKFFYIKQMCSILVLDYLCSCHECPDSTIYGDVLPAILVGLPLGRPWQKLVSYHTRVLAL